MADEVDTRIRVVRRIRCHHLPPLQRPVRNHTTARHRVPVELVRPAEHREVGQADLIRVPVDDSRHSEVARVDGIMANVELEVTAVVELAPLELAVVLDEVAARVVCGCDGDVVTCWAGTGDRRTGEFDTLCGFRGQLANGVKGDDHVAGRLNLNQTFGKGREMFRDLLTILPAPVLGS